MVPHQASSAEVKSEVLCPVLGSPVQKDMVILEQVQLRTMNMVKRQEHLIYKEKLKEIGLFREEKAEEEESHLYDRIYRPDGRI